MSDKIPDVLIIKKNYLGAREPYSINNESRRGKRYVSVEALEREINFMRPAFVGDAARSFDKTLVKVLALLREMAGGE